MVWHGRILDNLLLPGLVAWTVYAAAGAFNSLCGPLWWTLMACKYVTVGMPWNVQV
jgi:hypothetical protein